MTLPLTGGKGGEVPHLYPRKEKKGRKRGDLHGKKGEKK